MHYTMTNNSKPSTILITDDQPESLNMLISCLESKGYNLMAALSGQSALDQAQRFPPDLILLDVMMPGDIDGFETCRRLKQSPITRDIPVIFLTVLDHTIDKVKGFAAGGVDFICKPAEHAEVLARVETHLHIRRLQQALQKENDRRRALTDAMFDGVIIHDRFRIAEVNSAVTSLFGFDREKLLTMSLKNLFTHDDQSYFENRMWTEENPVELSGLRKDGSIFPIELQSRPVFWQDQEMHVSVIRDLSRRKTLEKENRLLRDTLKERYRFGRIIGKSPVMQDLYELIARAAATDATVLFLGESGSGKEVAARTVHDLSSRKNHAFVAVNCGAVSDALFEREFFGHCKGAFTGADRDKPGFFDAAQGGTLFLDEIGELTPCMQAALLRVIEHHEYIPVGGTQAKHSDVRIIAATHRNLQELIRIGKFRQDFYYRLDMLTITIPSLQERKEDIPLLIDHFLEQRGKNNEPCTIPDEIRKSLCRSEWPGNVRQLYHTLERWLITGRLDLKQQETPGQESQTLISLSPVKTDLTLEKALEQTEKEMILHALRQNRWKKSRTAAQLGLNRKTLYEKMKKYGLPEE